MIQRKVCFVGDFAVGKTSLFNRVVYDRFSHIYHSTVGVRVQRGVQNTTDALILWDTEGGRETAAIKASYLVGAAGAIVVCDLTRPQTILRSVQYIEQVRRANPAINVVLAANKLDLVAPDHVGMTLAQHIAARLAVPLVCTSASSGDGMTELYAAMNFHAADALIAA